MKYRKKPVVVEAFQMTRTRLKDRSEWPEWLNQAWDESVFWYSWRLDCIRLKTLKGDLIVKWDSWIILDDRDELYPCDDEIFRMTYEEVVE